MELTEVYQALGRERFEELVRLVSMGSLRTYKVYDNFKLRTRLSKLNRERLRRAIPALWQRVEGGDQDLAKELAQGVLVSHMPFVTEVLDFLEIPHDGNGFFDKEEPVAERLTGGWRERIFEEFHKRYPEPLVLLYINHLDWELGQPETPFVN